LIVPLFPGGFGPADADPAPARNVAVATAERAAMTTNSLRRCVKSTVHLARAGSAPERAEASSPGDVVLSG
jgi:hypothetical protein